MADGNGNITQLVDMATGDSKAHYEYDPFGNLIQSELLSGLQIWNKFRFSTKQIEEELLIPTTSSSAGVSRISITMDTDSTAQGWEGGLTRPDWGTGWVQSIWVLRK